MALKVEIFEREIVSPFSPTPESLRNYKLSLNDQTNGTHHIPSVFFYTSSGSHHHDYDHLKESLSKTLSILYPLAGRVAEDGLTIECNDKGVDFVRANVTNYDLGDFLRGFPKVDALQYLLPRDPYAMEFDYSEPTLSVRVNKFGCGGTAIAICLWHGVADGATLAGFVQTWTAINRGEGVTSPEKFIVDLTTKIFPPAQPNFDFSMSTSSYIGDQRMHLANYSRKRFVFSKQEIERMRDEHNVSDHHHRRPSRVVALFSFIWAAVIRATLQANQDLKNHVLIHTVDLRKRMNPPLPSMCLGNIMHVCCARWEANERGGNDVVTSQSLIGRIREAIAKVDGDHVREMQAKVQTTKMGNILSDTNAIKFFGISSLCGFPFRESNFGWGKPIWFVPVINAPKDGTFFFDTTDDGGIEVWLGLTHQVMSNLDQDNEFLAHVSCSQIIRELYFLPTQKAE